MTPQPRQRGYCVRCDHTLHDQAYVIVASQLPGSTSVYAVHPECTVRGERIRESYDRRGNGQCLACGAEIPPGVVHDCCA